MMMGSYPNAFVNFPGPEHNCLRSRTPLAFFISRIPSSGSSARISTIPHVRI